MAGEAGEELVGAPMNIFDEFVSVVSALEAATVRHMLVGGVAMAFHDEPRFTEDTHFLIYPADLEKCTSPLNGIGFEEMVPPRTFTNNNMTLHRFLQFAGEDHSVIDIMEANEDRHQQMLNRADEAGHEGIKFRIVRREDLIPLKEERNSDQDRVDIKRLKNGKENG